MKSEKKKRIYQEEVKTKHTTHWDLDYLSQAELKALYGENRLDKRKHDRHRSRFSRQSVLLAILAGASALLMVALLLLVFRP